MRLAAIILGLAFLLWLPFEDVALKTVFTFALAISSWWGARLLVSVPLDPKRSLVRHLLVGLLTGLAVTPIALGLMAFKTGIHGHGAADFTTTQIGAVIRRTPVWIGGGALIGLGSALWRISREERSDKIDA